jgi:hypothetical protein
MKRTKMFTSRAVQSRTAAWMMLLLDALPAVATTEEQISRRFAVQTGGAVVVEVDFGTIKVSTNATSEVVVDVWRKVKRRQKADEEKFLKESAVQFTQDGNTIRVRSHRDQKDGWASFWKGPNETDAKYTISVPAQFNVRLNTGGGGISVSDVTGEVKANTGGGNLNLARVRGPLAGNTGGGGIEATDCEGTINLNTGGGRAAVSGGGGALELKTGGGGVSAKKFDGPVRLQSGGGELSVEHVTGEINGSTGGGSIHAVMPSEIAANVRLSTGGGGITVSIPTTAAFSLDAHTSGGSVSSELPVTVVGKMQEGRLEGTVNGGGKAVVLRSGGGGIHIKKL